MYICIYAYVCIKCIVVCIYSIPLPSGDLTWPLKIPHKLRSGGV